MNRSSIPFLYVSVLTVFSLSCNQQPASQQEAAQSRPDSSSLLPENNTIDSMSQVKGQTITKEADNVNTKPKGFQFLQDFSHQDNENITLKKDSVITFYSEVSNWYAQVNDDYFLSNENLRSKTQLVIDNANNNFLPKIRESKLLTERYKKEIAPAGKVVDRLENMATLMLQDTLGYIVTYIKPRNNSDYQDYMMKYYGYNTVPVEYEFVPDLGADTVQNFLREMTTIYESSATVTMPYFLIDGDPSNPNYFLVFTFLKEGNGWLLDQFTIKEEEY